MSDEEFQHIKDKLEEYADKLPSGPYDPADVPEVLRKFRHFMANDHDAISGLWYIAKENEKLAKKALEKTDHTDDRIALLIGVPGQKDLDGGGAIGRLETRFIEVQNAVTSQGTQNKWIIGLLISVALGLFALAGVIFLGKHP